MVIQVRNAMVAIRNVLIPRSGNVLKPRVASEASYPGTSRYLIQPGTGCGRVRPLLGLQPLMDLYESTSVTQPRCG